ncbi:hypothetical protein, partial [uncultured Amphritea sp.]|uniref:hypothetical protein n=1 Tax=uncultured Amphritea sp. TaxID=981605 RepID=UPI002636D39C
GSSGCLGIRGIYGVMRPFVGMSPVPLQQANPAPILMHAKRSCISKNRMAFFIFCCTEPEFVPLIPWFNDCEAIIAEHEVRSP